MSTVKTNQVTHLNNTGTANVQLDSSGNTTVADLTANSVTAQSVTLSNNLTVNGNTTIGNSSSDTVAFNATVSGSNFEAGIIGEMRMWSTGTAPTGWLICNGDTIGAVGSGATHESASYSQLFDLIKGTSGAGLYGNTGTESFVSGNTVKLPDFRGRMPIGVGQQSNTKYNSTADNYTNSGTNFGISDTGGTEDHKITENELAQHTHTATTDNDQAAINDPGHFHNIDEAQLAHKHDLPDHTHAYTDPLQGSGGTSGGSGSSNSNPTAYGGSTIIQLPTGGAAWEAVSVTPGDSTYWSSFVDSSGDPLVESKTTGITDTGHNHTVTVNNTGDSGNNPTSILNPYLAINFIIKF